VTTYNGDVHREGDVWVAEVREVPQAHTYGRTLRRTKEYLRDALGLVLDVAPESLDIAYHIRLSGGVGDLVEAAAAARLRAEEVVEESRRATEDAAVALVQDAKLSRRDAAAALGLSYQRVDQLIRSTRRTAPRKRPIEPEPPATESDQERAPRRKRA
jgi:predicted RNase H-like HicB family nuclease